MYILFLVFAQTGSIGWPAASFGDAVAATAVFALAGLLLAVVGCRLFDDGTPEGVDAEIEPPRHQGAALS